MAVRRLHTNHPLISLTGCLNSSLQRYILPELGSSYLLTHLCMASPDLQLFAVWYKVRLAYDCQQCHFSCGFVQKVVNTGQCLSALVGLCAVFKRAEQSHPSSCCQSCCSHMCIGGHQHTQPINTTPHTDKSFTKCRLRSLDAVPSCLLKWVSRPPCTPLLQ